MHLKSLTLRGFKSFASTTTLNFEPGITCVVGPNGSGKSNVVDALAWVMGEQGAKSLRGGKMEDVIFAGTAGRAPLGRAEVLLTIDNTDGALPIDYAEVTISRIMFRNGGSEYSINGTPSRLLDVQELLSDSGIGREMHVIVGQGQLDAILHASPEERRGFIEEAAGVLKHRKRKEKALRKLEAMQANLTRLQDLTTELRRQLKPLGKQAEVARRAQVIQADLRDSRLRLLADDLIAMSATLEQEVADETALRERQAEVEAAMASDQSREAVLEADLAADAPVLARTQETWYRLSALRERLDGTLSLASDRMRLLAPDSADEAPGRDPAELEGQAREARAEEFDLGREVEVDRAALADAVRNRAEAESVLAAEERRLEATARAVADRREGLARLSGQVAAARERFQTRDAETRRLAEQVEGARSRADSAATAFRALENEIAGLDQGELGLDEEHEEAAGTLAEVEGRIEALRLADQETDRDRAALQARVEALELGLARRDGGAALLAAGEEVSGLLGSVAALIRVEHGYEAAVAAALGSAADAVAVADHESAVAALRRLRSHDAGRATLVVAAADTGRANEPWPTLPEGARYAIDVVTAPPELRPALADVLARVAVVATLDDAQSLVASHPSLTAVTRDGDVIGPMVASGGSSGGLSLLEVQAALDEARERFAEVSHRCERVRFDLERAAAEHAEALAVAHTTLARLHDSDARMAAVAEQLGQLGSAARASAGEAERLAASQAAATSARADDEATLAELSARLVVAESEPDESTPSTDERDRMAEVATAARSTEVDARLAVRTGEERIRAVMARAESLERAARDERESIRRALERKARREREAITAAAVRVGAEYALARLEQSIASATVEREGAEALRARRDGELQQTRARLRTLGAEHEQLVDVVHRDEVARAEQRLRIEALELKAMEDFGIAPEVLIDEYGPGQPVPPSPSAPGDEIDPNAPEPQPYPYDRGQQERRMRSAERALALLGRVNPLALEEFSALEERNQFLTEQLEDVKQSRRDLLEIIREVDERVQQVFTEAFRDTEREFEGVFARLFPGGEGRLILTDPNDMLTTGIEVEARPPGKKIKRLSLLSGGERSLTAVAFLVALFKARPSPFYVMDEVEAALDDVNLGRLLGVMDELRENSQLIVVTHQKRTMEIADALYGVTMRGDGVTTVISQRLRDVEDQTA